MAAVTTKKPGGDVAIELTFPAVFQEVYADSGEAERYAPTFPLAPPKMEEAQDLQGAYHEQKRKDAHHMVMAGLIANKTAEGKMLASHMNYFGMPKPVLSQRRFANPSLGNLSGAIDSARRTMPDSSAPFRCMTVEEAAGDVRGGCGSCYETQLQGGVLRTKEGQRWAAEKLQGRVKQLDAIDAAALTPDALDDGTGVEYPDVASEFAPKAKLELLAALDQVENALLASQLGSAVRFAITDLASAAKMLVRFATVADREELEAAYARIDSINQSVRGLAAARAPGGAQAPPRGVRYQGARAQIAADNAALARSIYNRLEAMKAYLGMMLKGVNYQPKDRQTLSRTALQSSGLLNFPALTPAARAAAQQAVAAQLPGGAPGGPRPPGGPGGPRPPGGPPDDGGDTDDADTDSDEPPGGRARFDVDNRQRRAARQGAYQGEAFAVDEAGAAAVRNPMRRQQAAVALRPLVEAADPAFLAMPAAMPPPPPGRSPAASPQYQAAAAIRRALLNPRGPQGAAAVAADEGLRAAAVAEQVAVTTRSGRQVRKPGSNVVARGKAVKRGKGKEEERKAAAARRKAAVAAANARSLHGVLKKRAESPPPPKKKAKATAAAPAPAPAAGAAATAAAPRRTAAHDIADDWWRTAEKGYYEEEVAKMPAVTRKGKETLYAEKLATTKYPSKGSGHGLTRATLPTTREGYVELAAKLRKDGHNIRVNSGSQLKSIRANFIKRLGL
jgi:hypothetical protein